MIDRIHDSSLSTIERHDQEISLITDELNRQETVSSATKGLLKLVKSGTVIFDHTDYVPVASDYYFYLATKTIPHGLGFAPIFRSFYTNNSTSPPKPQGLLPATLWGELDGTGYGLQTVSVDATNVYVRFEWYNNTDDGLGVVYYLYDMPVTRA